MSWDSDFVRPIVLPNKIVVTTLRQVLAYISEHPEDQQNSPAWHKARECTRIRSDLFGSRASRSCRHFNETDKNRLTKLQVPSRSLAEKICDPKLRLPPLKQNPEKFSGRGTFEAERSSGPFDSSHHSATANVAPSATIPRIRMMTIPTPAIIQAQPEGGSNGAIDQVVGLHVGLGVGGLK
jgi:hypothetical protein